MYERKVQYGTVTNFRYFDIRSLEQVSNDLGLGLSPEGMDWLRRLYLEDRSDPNVSSLRFDAALIHHYCALPDSDAVGSASSSDPALTSLFGRISGRYAKKAGTEEPPDPHSLCLFAATGYTGGILAAGADGGERNVRLSVFRNSVPVLPPPVPDGCRTSLFTAVTEGGALTLSVSDPADVFHGPVFPEGRTLPPEGDRDTAGFLVYPAPGADIRRFLSDAPSAVGAFLSAHPGSCCIRLGERGFARDVFPLMSGAVIDCAAFSGVFRGGKYFPEALAECMAPAALVTAHESDFRDLCTTLESVCPSAVSAKVMNAVGCRDDFLFMLSKESFVFPRKRLDALRFRRNVTLTDRCEAVTSERDLRVYSDTGTDISAKFVAGTRENRQKIAEALCGGSAVAAFAEVRPDYRGTAELCALTDSIYGEGGNAAGGSAAPDEGALPGPACPLSGISEGNENGFVVFSRVSSGEHCEILSPEDGEGGITGFASPFPDIKEFEEMTVDNDLRSDPSAQLSGLNEGTGSAAAAFATAGRGRIYEDARELCGNTPLLRVHPELPGILLYKLELFNPTGSSKYRAALFMVKRAEEQGLLAPGGTVVEPTSGNTGIALASVCVPRGYRTVIVMPENMSEERKSLLRAYGAQLVLTPASGGMSGAVEKAKELVSSIPGAYMPSQFDNPANSESHFLTTGPEIWNATHGNVDIIVAGVGSGGTLCGAAAFLKKMKPSVLSVACEPASSPRIGKGYSGKHAIQGIGANFIPGNFDSSAVDRIAWVTDAEAYAETASIAKITGLLAGISSGCAAFEARRLASLEENRGKTVVAVLPDSGEHYISTGVFGE